VLAAMAVEGADLAWLHFLFLLRLCAHGGWAPDLQHCSTCGRQASPTQAACFDPQEGGLRCRVCGGRGVPLPGALRVQLQCCATGPFCPQPPAGAETWLRFATPLDAFVQHHCPVAP
ncbi:MAG: DNA repair protein RecO, partial [Polyangiales bacterium]